jgi:hypothetical protein
MIFYRFLLRVNSICINQEDQKEKSKQIPLMRDIYATAKSVLVWLGPSFRGVAAAFEVLPYLAMVGVERHPTGKPDTEKLEDILGGIIKERPKNGSIIQSQVVAILEGAYVPYLLGKCESHYELISHVYVEGIMSMESLPASWKVDRIRLDSSSIAEAKRLADWAGP